MTVVQLRSVFLWCSVSLFAGLFFLKAAQIHQTFGTAAYDLGIFAQSSWLLANLIDPFNTVRGLHTFGDHFEPIGILLAPLYRLFPSVLLLLLVQALAVAWGAIVLHRISLRVLPARHLLATVIAICYLFNPLVHNPLLWHYHTLVLALPLYLLWIEAYLDRNDRRFFMLLILLLLVREDIPATTVCFGLVALAQKRWRLGLATIALSLLWWLFVSKVAMPYFNGEGYFRHKAGTVGILITHLFDLQYYVQRFWEDRDAVKYLAYVFLPLLLLSLRSPLWLLPAIPSLLANVLIGGYNTQIQIHHYTVNALPFVFVAAIMSLPALLTKNPRLAPWLMASLLAATSVASWTGSSMSIRSLPADLAAWNAHKPLRARVAEYEAKLGRDTGIAANDFLLPHLANRERIYLFPNPWVAHYWGINGERPHHPNNVDYLFLNPEHTWAQFGLLEYLQNEGYFTTEFQDERLWVLRRLRAEPGDRDTAIKASSSYLAGSLPGIAIGRAFLSPVYPHPPGGIAEAPFIPRSGPPPGDWQQSTSGGATLLQIDLQVSPGIDFATRYVYLPIAADKESEVEILLGSDDTLEVWFEGEKVLEHSAPRPARLGDNHLSLSLRKGTNHLYFRVDNLGGAWRLITRVQLLRDKDSKVAPSE